MAAKTASKTPAEAAIVIPAINLRTISIPVVGVTPLIMHKFDEKAMRMIEAKQQGKAQQKKAPKQPKDLYRAAIYFDENGDYAMPATAFKASAIGGMRQVEGLTMKGSSGAFHVEGNWVRIYGNPRMRSDLARNKTGVVDTRYRPEFVKWCAIVRITFNANVLTEEVLFNLFNVAGFAQGIGDWRPGSKENYSGSFGRYRVAGADEVKKLIAEIERDAKTHREFDEEEKAA